MIARIGNQLVKYPKTEVWPPDVLTNSFRNARLSSVGFPSRLRALKS